MGTYKGRDRGGGLDRVGFEEAQAAFNQDSFVEKNVTQSGAVAPLPAVLSCQSGLTSAQKRVFGRLMAIVGISGLLVPEFFLSALGVIFWTLFAAFVLWRFVLLLWGLALLDKRGVSLPLLEERELPIYTVMVAAYDEGPVMRQLADALTKLNWPADRLDIMLLLEADDDTTLQAALKAGFPIGSRLIVVPDGTPRTKPRALNYGLRLARGKFICIYDAEDRPHPDQLREAYNVFLSGDARLACVQAPLIGTGAKASLVAAHWCLEYAVQFRFILPALSALRAPIPLGGTSNHFRATRLRDAGGWDAWNVTEDADLGLRFARLGWRIGMVKQGTLEDAPRALGVWCRQRSRWIKGFIQTWFVLMRYPSTVIRQMGLHQFLCLQLTLGSAILAPLFHGPFTVFVFAGLIFSDLSIGHGGWTLMTAGFLVTLIGDLGVPGVPVRPRLRAALTRPLYWPLHSLAAGMALYDLVVRPHYWAKTPHQAIEESFTECSTGSSQSD